MRNNRRKLFFALGTGAIAVPLAPRAYSQDSSKTWRLGFLSGNPATDTATAFEDFKAKLRESGYVEGRNLRFETRFADGKYERLPELASELLKGGVDLLFCYGSPASLTAKRTTNTVPIVFAGVADPLSIGLVDRINRPGGNLTGVTSNSPALSGKRLSLLKEAIPSLKQVAILINLEFKPSVAVMESLTEVARPLGLQLKITQARSQSEIRSAFEQIANAKLSAVFVSTDPLFVAERRLIGDLALKNRLPTTFHLRQFVEVGGLMSYGVTYNEEFQQAATQVDKILRGAKPGDQPVEQPWRIPLSINMSTLRALGLTLPSTFLLQVNDVIQ